MPERFYRLKITVLVCCYAIPSIIHSLISNRVTSPSGKLHLHSLSLSFMPSRLSPIESVVVRDRELGCWPLVTQKRRNSNEMKEIVPREERSMWFICSSQRIMWCNRQVATTKMKNTFGNLASSPRLAWDGRNLTNYSLRLNPMVPWIFQSSLSRLLDLLLLRPLSALRSPPPLRSRGLRDRLRDRPRDLWRVRGFNHMYIDIINILVYKGSCRIQWNKISDLSYQAGLLLGEEVLLTVYESSRVVLLLSICPGKHGKLRNCQQNLLSK